MARAVTTILVPTDFSETADTALEYAAALAARFGASLHLLHVFTDPYRGAPGADLYAPVAPDLQERALDEAQASLATRLAAHQTTARPGTCAVVSGLTAKQIAQYADDHAIDLIVMGTHGRRGVAHLLLGSVAEHVVRIAPCPVLTVRGESRPLDTRTPATCMA
jgi:universal stress protein A